MNYLRNLSLKYIRGKICLLRIDLNISKPSKETLRIKAVIPTIKYLLKNKSKVIILSHKGRPEQKSNIIEKFSLMPFCKLLSYHLKQKIKFIPLQKFFDFDYRKSDYKIFLLENLRFLQGEKENDKKLAQKLSFLGDFYVNDAFAVCHRKNASLVAITNYLPCFAGFLLEKEMQNLNQAMNKYKKPLVILLGGAKVKGKIKVMKYFLKKADYFLLGGSMAFTFFRALGVPVGNSKVEKDQIPLAGKLLRKIKSKIFLPIDTVVENKEIMTIGQATVKQYSDIICKAKTIIWNGPFGFIENKKYREPTLCIAKKVLSNKKAKIIIGGGETTTMITRYKIQDTKIFLSTGGGAMLEYLSGKKLPGIEALKKSSSKHK